MTTTPTYSFYGEEEEILGSTIVVNGTVNFTNYLSYSTDSLTLGQTVTWYYKTFSESVNYEGYVLSGGVEYPAIFDGFSFDVLGLGNGTYTLTYGTYTLPCFLAGTQIAAEAGAVAVERLAIGDRVRTASGVLRAIKWIGQRSVSCRRHPSPETVWPIRIAAGAFSSALPRRDLYLSPDHAVFAEGVLIPVKHLINGATIVQEPRKRVSYYHIELDSHDVILAEGLPCESYLDNGTRSAFANGTIVQLHPQFSPAERCEATGEAAACAPLRIEGEAFARVAAELRRRAEAMGLAAAEPAPRPAVPPPVSIDLTGLLQPEWYLANNPDVAAAGVDARVHYVSAGRAEGRLPCKEAELISGLGLIDSATIIRTMPDVVVAGADLAEHFCQHGWRERRRPNAYFDPAWYLDTYAVPAGMNPLVHYILFGEQAGLAPSPHFDPAWYRQTHGLGVSVCALAHYLSHRRSQTVSPLRCFDVAAYVKAHAQTLPPQRDPYAHFLAIGRFAAAEGLRPAA